MCNQTSVMVACLMSLLVFIQALVVAFPSPTFGSELSNFVGADVCKTCHQKEYALWKGSHHDLAMQLANDNSVQGNFNHVEFTHFDVTSTFFRKGNEYWVKTDNEFGKLQAFQILYTFGVYPLQQYLIQGQNGRYQALSIAWDSRSKNEGGQRWFHLYPDENIPSDDSLHWTGPYLNWNSQCADCHSTNLKKNYDFEKDTYNTQWSEVNVACEACHGPGQKHLAWSSLSDAKKIKDPLKGWLFRLDDSAQWAYVQGKTTLQPIDSKASHTNNRTQSMIEVCAHCHSRRRALSDFNHKDGFFDQHELQLMEPPLYHPDGQIHDEVYVFGSFLQSKMHDKGVTCSNCHEPHSLTLRHQDNALCTQCHQSNTFDTKRHHHHPPDTEGAFCINCHMPSQTYMGVDVRRDHSFRIPRPDLSVSLKTPNACTQCHDSKEPQWAASAIKKWLKQTNKPMPKHFSDALMADEATPLSSVATNHYSAMVKGSMLAQSPRLPAQLPTQPWLKNAREQLNSPEPLVRIGAIKALEPLPILQRWQALAPLITDPIKAVRIAVARLLMPVPESQLLPKDARALQQLNQEYLNTLIYSADTPAGQMELGLYYLNKKQWALAEKAYKKAIAFDQGLAPAYINLADFYRSQKKEDQSEKTLRLALKKAPQPIVHYSLGLSLIRQKRYEEALSHLSVAVKGDPNNPQFSYVYSIALKELNKK